MPNVTKTFSYGNFKVIGVLSNTDGRTPIRAYEATINDVFFDEPELGNLVIGLSDFKNGTGMTVSEGIPAWLCNLTWRKFNENTGEWVQPDSGDVFTEGTYRIQGSVRADSWTTEAGLNGNSHYVADSCTVTINEEPWNTEYYSSRWTSGSTQTSVKQIWSDEYVLVDDGTSSLTANNFTLGNNNYYLSANKAINEVDISDKVIGGKRPYTFEKKSGPDWINVSSDGEITGTPTAQAGESQLVVKVTDSSNPANSAEMTCPVGAVGIDLDDRIQVHEVVINDHRFNRPRCNTQAPGMFEVGIQPDEDGEYNHPASMTNSNWRLNDGDWPQLGSGHTFTEGNRYALRTHLRIDEESVTDPSGNKIDSRTHVLAPDCKLIVNGVEWEKEGSLTNKKGDTEGALYSSQSFQSPTMTVEHRMESPITDTVTKKATASEDGILERVYPQCLDCHETKATDTYTIKYVASKKATTTEDGIKAHYEIVETGQWYWDDECTEFIEHHEETVIPKVSSIKLSATSYTYNGYVKSPYFNIYDRTGKKLTYGTDYTYTRSSGRKNVGTYNCYLTFKGDYSGKKTASFKINPKGTTIKTPYRYKGAIKARWSKQSSKMAKSRIYGYQIAYATKSDFSNAKYAYSNKYKYTSKKISKLKRKTYYYVKVRTRMKVGGVWHYSGWSKVKKVKTK